MRISRIFTNTPLDPQQLVSLDEKASHHLSKVLRLKTGAELTLFNGNGHQYPSVIETIEKKTVTVKTGEQETVDNESPLQTHLGIAVSKSDRMDWVMQKATELGITEITPLFSERTEFKLNADRQEKKQQHWQQIIISACEQCGRNTLPVLNPLQRIESWVESVPGNKKFVLHHRTSAQLDSNEKVSSVTLLIGPEGGLSDREIHGAQEKGFGALSLGPRVLRTETAPLAALSILQSVWGDC